ncbi:MAG TPA: ABC transporter transmembrane domain-containing protein, partial [Actinoplanes sp.]
MPTLTSPRSTVRSLARLGPWVRPIRGRLAAAGIIVPLAATMRSFRRRSARVYTRRSEALAAVTTRTAETFAGIRAVQALRMQGANDAVFADFNGHHRHLNGAAGLEMARYVTASRLVANIAVATLMLWGAHRVAAGGVELGVFAAVVLNLRRLYDEPLRLGGVVEAYQSASASLRAIAAILTRQPAVDEPTHPAGLPAQPFGQPGRAVLFDQVSF